MRSRTLLSQFLRVFLSTCDRVMVYACAFSVIARY